MALMVLPIPWTYGVQVSTLDGQTKAYAIIQFSEAIISGGVTVLVLYLNLDRQLALFIGGTTGAIFTVFGTLWILRPYLGGALKFRWLREIAAVGAASFVSTLAERMQTVAERSFISRYVGIDQLGIYSHSQQYRTLVMAGSNSVAYSVWPISLQEAREESGKFPRTIQAWRMTGAAIAIIGIVFATLGEYLIGFLTHGKFASAYIFSSLWMAYLLIQSTGRIQTARFYVSRAGVSNQNAISVSIVLSIATLAVLTPTFGIHGVLVGVFLQVTVYRGLLNVIGQNDPSLAFVDGPLIAGAVIVIASTAMAILEPTLAARLLNLLISCVLTGLVFKSALLRALEVSIFARIFERRRSPSNPPEPGP
jgi:O-antigen/teichoic acid export membrane protein